MRSAPERAYSLHRREAQEPAGSHRRDVPTRSPSASRRANGEPGPPSPDTHVSLEVPMPLMAVAFPILPGKTAEWRVFMDELNGPRHAEFIDSRRKAGVHERTFLQSTPMGDLVIVTLEGDDPGHAFAEMMSADDRVAIRAGRRHGLGTWRSRRAARVRRG